MLLLDPEDERVELLLEEDLMVEGVDLVVEGVLVVVPRLVFVEVELLVVVALVVVPTERFVPEVFLYEEA